MALNWRGDFLRYKKYFLDIRAVYNQRQDLKMFLEIILSLAAISIFSLFALRPTLLTISELLTELEEKEETAAQMDTKIQNLRLAQGVYNNEQQRIGLLGFAVPETSSPETLIRQIEGQAKRANVNIVGITTGEIALQGSGKTKKDDKDLMPLPPDSQGFTISFSANGTYQDLSNFLTAIENLRRPVFIDSISFTAVRTDTEQRLVLTVSGRGVYEK